MDSTIRSTISFCVVLLVLAHVAVTSQGTGVQLDPAPAAACDQTCLANVMDGFIKAMTSGKTAAVPLAQDAEIRENTKVVTLDSTAWKQVKAIRSSFVVAVCNRFHSGQQVTNVVRNAVEGGRGMTCSESNTGDRPWGPAGEQRFPVIDTERGLVFGVTLLHYLRNPTPSQMYVSEVFKVVGGKIVKIDNIGLMMQGVTTLGFAH